MSPTTNRIAVLDVIIACTTEQAVRLTLTETKIVIRNVAKQVSFETSDEQIEQLIKQEINKIHPNNETSKGK
jgi:uncharacterized protein YpuA (DUF1002 family)